MNAAEQKSENDAAIRGWLFVVYGMILGMTMLGGITRLTGSGLSMVEWHPLMGTLPPIGEAEWLAVFAQYKLSPQYLQVNEWMELADFKRIFFWEYCHRLFGRLIGVVFFLPWILFVVRKQLRGGLAFRTALIFVGGGLQGLLGWYMVQSGLVDKPEVSHYRLAAHLLLACVLAVWVLWTFLDLNSRKELRPPKSSSSALRWGFIAAIIGIFIQIGFGALMAGTRAGYLYANFPKMNGRWIPSNLLMEPLGWRNLVDNPTGIHFTHRALAWVVAFGVLVLCGVAWQKAQTEIQRLSVRLLAACILGQFLLGVLTVIYSVPVPIAVAHQGCAVLLLSAGVFGLYAFGESSGVITEDLS